MGIGQSRWRLLLAAPLFIGQAQAADLFGITVTTEGETASQTFSSAIDMFDAIDDDLFTTLAPAYTDTSLATSLVNFRGVPMVLEYRDAGNTLYFSVPELGIEEAFTGNSRRNSENAFIAYFKGNENHIGRDITRYAIAETAADPVAGNPGSLMSQMAGADYSVGTRGTTGALPEISSDTTTIAFGARFGRYSIRDQDSNVYSLPLRTSIAFGGGKALIVDLPLTLVEIENAYSYSGSLGLGVRLPITSIWTLTPAVRAGVVGSSDLGALAYLYNGSLTSNLHFALPGFELDIGNSAMLSQAGSAEVKGYEFEYDVSNVITRNGATVTRPLSRPLFGHAADLQLAAVNTQFFGDQLFIENYTDLAVSVGLSARPEQTLMNFLRVGLTYSFGDNGYQAGSINFGYQF